MSLPLANRLYLVTTDSQVSSGVANFGVGAIHNVAAASSLMRTTTYWVWNPDDDKFGPGKFIGLQKMSFELYQEALGEQTSSVFHGHKTKEAISRVLKLPFAPSPGFLEPRLVEWGKRTFGFDVFDGVDKSKWEFISLRGNRRYWAILCNPKVYDIDGAIHGLGTDCWSLPRGQVSPGDRVLIWRTKGTDDFRGVVGLAEVTSEPYLGTSLDRDNQYWCGPRPIPDERVFDVKYVLPPRGHLWLSEDDAGVLNDLTVRNGQGTRAYKVTPMQWFRVLNALGGWPESDQPIDSQEVQRELASNAQDVIDAAVARIHGQGYCNDPKRNKAVEMVAMGRAKNHFMALGYDCLDTSANNPYDLFCTKDGQKLYVEVKGTISSGDQIILTRNEVEHAKAHPGESALFIVSGISISYEGDEPIASGGNDRSFCPWTIDVNALRPVTYRYEPGVENEVEAT